MPAPIAYQVTVGNVREIALRGTADLGFWRGRLRGQRLEPDETDGRARLWIGATSARFLGIRFRELVICVLLREPAGMYLAHALNSVRAFAWFERTLFGTPYYPARLAVELEPAPAVAAAEQGVPLLTAAMSPQSASAMQAARSGTDEVLESAIYLPARRGESGSSQLFYARLAGLTQTCPFDADRDTFQVHPTPKHPPLSWLTESNFTPEQWLVRANATHSKSKTVRRTRF